MKPRNRTRLLAAVTALALAVPVGVGAQQGTAPRTPEMDFVMGGMGAFSYGATLEGPFEHNFGAKLAPILLWNMGSDFLFEGHIEFELEDGQTNTHLEYAQIDYQGIKNVQIVVGKFLVPFGVFGQRLHPVWINRMASFPLTFLDGDQVGGGGRLLPVISDIGAMAEVSAPLSDEWSLDLSAYVTQGPQTATGAAEGSQGSRLAPLASRVAAQIAPGGVEIPGVDFGTTYDENNKNKMIGARLGLVGLNGLELYVSGLHAKYDTEDRLAINGLDVAGWWHHENYRVRAEGVVMWQQFDGATGIETFRRPGYYVQVSRRMGKFEPVVRWSHVLDAEVSGTSVVPKNRQIAEGLDYWFHPNIVAKVELEQNLDGTDQLLVQWGFGF